MSKPPADPAVDHLSWAEWDRTQRALAFPGWSACRFAHRAGPVGSPEVARFVFGIVNGPFGIWTQNYQVAHNPGLGWVVEHNELAVLTHLPTGDGMGLFGEVGHAVLAADTAVRTCPEFAEFDTLPQGTVTRAIDAWTKLGIQPAENAHAHDISTGNGPFAIMGLASLEDGKPERLS